MALSGLERDLLLVHGLRVELGERAGGATEGGVERPIHLVQPRRLRLPLPPHRIPIENRRSISNPRTEKKRDDEAREILCRYISIGYQNVKRENVGGRGGVETSGFCAIGCFWIWMRIRLRN